MNNILTINGVPFYMRALDKNHVVISRDASKLDNKTDCLVYSLDQFKNSPNCEQVTSFLRDSNV